MITIRKSQDRGHINHGWLDTYHTFSFGDYHDRDFMGFRNLRVINEDFVESGEGFPTHGHRDMEIITYIIDGELSHKDSMGNGSTITAGEVQYMSAGHGVQHSEYNSSKKSKVHLLQIWILPNQKGAVPRYGQQDFRSSVKPGKLTLLVSPDGRENSIAIRQDSLLYAAKLEKNQAIEQKLDQNRFAWIQIAKGRVAVNGLELAAGDGASISSESLLTIKGLDLQSEFLLFDLN